MAAEEVKESEKDIPKGIIGSIIISTLLYIVVTLVLTGIVPFTDLGSRIRWLLRCASLIMAQLRQSFQLVLF